MNLYAYTGNDPVNFTDPTGEVAVSLGVDFQGSIFGRGFGVSAKFAVSLSRTEAGGLNFQAGGIGAVKTSAAPIAVGDSNARFVERASAFVASILDTGASAAVEGGVFVGTDANPADVKDLGGTSTALGGAIGKKSLLNVLGVNSRALNALPGASLTGQVVTGENGIRGLELGTGAGFGLTTDVEIAAEPIVLVDEEVD